MKKTLAELMISPAREALLRGGLDDNLRKINQAQDRIEAEQARIEAEQARLRTLEAERADLNARLDELHRLRKEAQA